MVNILSENGKVLYGIYEFLCDTEDDKEGISTDVNPGSTIFVIENSKTYMLNGSKEWIEVTL